MSYIDINGMNCYYECSGSGKDVVLFHGWGQNSEMMKYIFNHLKNRYRVYSFDFPGFGKSQELNGVYGSEDYAFMMKEAFDKLNIKKPIIIAHSFGCRVAFYYAKNFDVDKMILTGAAGIKEEVNFFNQLKQNFYKNVKKVLLNLKLDNLLNKLQNSVGSDDYKNASGNLRQSFVKIVNEDVREFLKDIKAEVLLVYGELDVATPISYGKEFEKLLQNSALVIFEKDDHYAYFNQNHRFNRVIDAFLGDVC